MKDPATWLAFLLLAVVVILMVALHNINGRLDVLEACLDLPTADVEPATCL